MKNLGKRIKEEIEKNYTSVAEFSRIMNIPYTTLNNITKNGLQNSKFRLIVDICKKLNISIFDIDETDELKPYIGILYRISSLDSHGIQLIENIIEKEYKRCIKF